MFLPFSTLTSSYLPTRKKVALLAVFMLGTFITIIQVVRIRTVKSLANYLDSGSLIMWSSVENNLGIIVASLPVLTPLVRGFSMGSLGSKREPKGREVEMSGLRQAKEEERVRSAGCSETRLCEIDEDGDDEEEEKKMESSVVSVPVYDDRRDIVQSC
jgi:hypothetical protein